MLCVSRRSARETNVEPAAAFFLLLFHFFCIMLWPLPHPFEDRYHAERGRNWTGSGLQHVSRWRGV